MSCYKSRKESLKCPVLSKEEPPTADANANNNVNTYISNTSNISNTNSNADNKAAVKVRERSVDAISAAEAQEQDRRAKCERNAHFDVGGEAGGSGAAGAAAAAAGDGAKATVPHKDPVQMTQFRWATLQIGGPAPGFRGTVGGAMAYDLK